MKTEKFPQANDLEKVYWIVRNFRSAEDRQIKTSLSLSSDRQLNYYKDAAEFLGFLSKEISAQMKLTELGQRVCALRDDQDARDIFFAAVLKNPVLRDCMIRSTPDLSNLEQVDSFEALAKETRMRRISTIKSWHQWIIKMSAPNRMT